MYFILFMQFALIQSALIRQFKQYSPVIRTLECIDMVKLNGAFQFVAGESESDCAIFFIGDVDEIVSLTITELNMRESCNQQDEYVKFFDGWNVNGIMIPHGRPVKDEPEKYFCSRRTYEATQNSAMISFKLKKGSSFKIELTTHSATDVCNAIIPRPSGRYTIEGQSGECSMHLIFPSDIVVRSVGLQSPGRRNKATVFTGHDISSLQPVRTLKRSFPSSSRRGLKTINGLDHSVITLNSSVKNRNYIEFEVLSHRRRKSILSRRSSPDRSSGRSGQ